MIEMVNDGVNHPNHYQTDSGIEAIDVMEAFTAHLTGAEATNTYQTIKYILRWKKKDGLKDLKKCSYYLNRLIEHVEQNEKEID